MSAPYRTTAIATWLTREEFLAAYATQLVAWLHPCYGFESLSEDDRHEFFSSLGRALRWSIRYLADRGFRFQGIEIAPNGELRPTTAEPVEPRNELFLVKIAAGRMVSPVLAIKAALKLIAEQEAQIDTGPMTEVLIQCEKDSRDAIAWWEEDQETAKMAEEVFKERMASMGLKPIDGGVN